MAEKPFPIIKTNRPSRSTPDMLADMVVKRTRAAAGLQAYSADKIRDPTKDNCRRAHIIAHAAENEIQ